MNSASAGSAFIYNEGGGSASFFNNSTAGSACILNSGGGTVSFLDSSTAGNSIIDFFDTTVVNFYGNSTAGNATINCTGNLFFGDSSQGGEAQIVVSPYSDFGAFLTIDHDVTIGSLAGGPGLYEQAYVNLGTKNLTVGSNNLSTTFSGVIQDDGSVTKIGTGTLTLGDASSFGGATSYTGGTSVNQGTLVVSNTTGSATGTGPLQVNAGTLGGSGIISGAVTIGTGSGARVFIAPAHGTRVQATLTIQNALTFNANATYTYTFKAKGRKARTDKVIANGITINSGAIFAFRGKALGALRQGMVLTVIGNTSATPIAGTFSNLPDGAILTVNGNNFQADYEGGDGNDLTLTVMP